MKINFYYLTDYKINISTHKMQPENKLLFLYSFVFNFSFHFNASEDY